jgi:hypothetical protein
MYICSVLVQCGARFSEAIPDAMRDVELLVEEMMGHVLLKLFGEGTVDDVSICFASYAQTKLKYYSMQIHAQFDHEGFILLPRTEEHIKEAIGRSMGGLLREIFLSAEVDAITLTPISWDCENTLPRSRSLS